MNYEKTCLGNMGQGSLTTEEECRTESQGATWIEGWDKVKGHRECGHV